jgi:hypothetical protein
MWIPPTEREETMPRKVRLNNHRLGGMNGIAGSVRATWHTAEAMTRFFEPAAMARGLALPGRHLDRRSLAARPGMSRMPARACADQLDRVENLGSPPR